MVEDNFLLCNEWAVAPEVHGILPGAIHLHEFLVASGDPFVSVEGSCTARIGVFRMFWNATYDQTPEGQVIQDAN